MGGCWNSPFIPQNSLWILEGSWEFLFKIKVPFQHQSLARGVLVNSRLWLSRILGWSFWNERLMMIPSSCWEKQVLATWQAVWVPMDSWCSEVREVKPRFHYISRCFMLMIKKFSDHCQFMELEHMTTIMLPHGLWLFDNVRERQTQNLSGASRLWNSRIMLYYPCRWSVKCLGGFCLFVICFR